MGGLTPDIVEFSRDVLRLTLSPAQIVILKTVYGLPLADEAELALFRVLSGLEEYPGHPFTECVLACGVRSGKTTRVLAPIVVYEALFGGWAARRKPGDQIPTMVLVAQNLRGVSGAVFSVLTQTIKDSLLDDVSVSAKTEELTFENGVRVMVAPNTQDAARGLSSPVAALDEVAVWATAGKQNDAAEIYATMQTRMFGLPGAKLVLASSLYLCEGLFYELFKSGWAAPHPDRITFKAPTRLMRGSEVDAEIAQARRLMDPARFRRDFECTPSERVSGFLDPDLIDGAIDHGCQVRSPEAGVSYVCGADVAGTGKDAFALSIIHEDDGTVIQDCAAIWTKRGDGEKDPYRILDSMAELAKSYGCRIIYGDGYARGYPRLHFYNQHGLRYVETDDVRQMARDLRGDRSRCYEETERHLLGHSIRLLDASVQTAQLKLLDRTLTEGGKSHIDHPGGGSDDACNALAVSVLGAANERVRRAMRERRDGPDIDERHEQQRDEVTRLAEHARAIHADSPAWLERIAEAVAVAVDQPDVALRWFQDLAAKARPDTTQARLRRAGVRY